MHNKKADSFISEFEQGNDFLKLIGYFIIEPLEHSNKSVLIGIVVAFAVEYETVI